MSLKVLYRTEVKLLVEVFRVGNLIMVKWSLKYVASKSILCFISINTKKHFWHMQKKWNSKFWSSCRQALGKFPYCKEMHQLGALHQVHLINLLVIWIFVKIDYRWAWSIRYIKIRSIPEISFRPSCPFFYGIA